MKTSPTLSVYVYHASGFLSGPGLVKCLALRAPAPFRITKRITAGYRTGLQIVRAMPDGADFVEVVDSKGRRLAAWKPCNVGRYTGTHDAAPTGFTEAR